MFIANTKGPWKGNGRNTNKYKVYRRNPTKVFANGQGSHIENYAMLLAIFFMFYTCTFFFTFRSLHIYKNKKIYIVKQCITKTTAFKASLFFLTTHIFKMKYV